MKVYVVVVHSGLLCRFGLLLQIDYNTRESCVDQEGYKGRRCE
jgi:hypothetical protein